jgi:hypothetical protein
MESFAGEASSGWRFKTYGVISRFMEEEMRCITLQMRMFQRKTEPLSAHPYVSDVNDRRMMLEPQ